MKRLLPVLLLSLLLASPALAQGTFDYASPTTVLSVGTGTITVIVFPTPGIKTLDCPSTGMLGLFCANVASLDTAGFEGDLPSDLQVAEIDQGYAVTNPAWDIGSGCIDSISTFGKYTLLDVDDGTGTNKELWCDPDKGLLGDFCSLLSVDDCTQFQGGFFPGDHDHPGERELQVIRATE